MMLRDVVEPGILYVDARQDCAVEAGARSDCNARHNLPIGDYAWLYKEELWVVEEKKPHDLANSLSNRRLHRQTRECLKQADRFVLALRCANEINMGIYGQDQFVFDPAQLHNLMYWNLLGPVVVLPASSNDTLDLLIKMRRDFHESNTRMALGGDDRKRPEGGTPFNKAVRRLLTGVGVETARKLDKAFEGDFMALLSAGEEALKGAGAHKGIRRQIKELQGNG